MFCRRVPTTSLRASPYARAARMRYVRVRHDERRMRIQFGRARVDGRTVPLSLMGTRLSFMGTRLPLIGARLRRGEYAPLPKGARVTLAGVCLDGRARPLRATGLSPCARGTRLALIVFPRSRRAARLQKTGGRLPFMGTPFERAAVPVTLPVACLQSMRAGIGDAWYGRDHARPRARRSWVQACRAPIPAIKEAASPSPAITLP